MANSSNTLTSRSRVEIGIGAHSKSVEVVTVDWVADDANGSVPDLALPLNGWLVKVITNPGATAPTANYDISLEDPADNDLDAAATLLNNRHTTTTEQVYPLISGAATPILLAGTYNVAVANNLVNSATGKIIFYLMDSL